MIDTITLLIIFIAIMAVNTISLFVLWSYLKKQMAFLEYWMLSFFLYSVGLILMSYNADLSSKHLMLVSNSFLMGSVILSTLGTYKLLNKKISRLTLLPLVIMAPLFAYFVYGHDDINLRIMMYSLITGYFYTIQLVFLIKPKDSIKKSYLYPMQIVIGAFVVVSFIRLLSSLIDPNINFVLRTSIEQYALLSFLVLYVVLELAVFLVVYGIYERQYLSLSYELGKNQSIKEVIEESEKKYRSLFQQMPLGIATHRMIYDDQYKPIDYIILNANKSYEKHTSLRLNEIIGKKVSEIIPNLESFWIRRYAHVIDAQQTMIFTEYSIPLQKYFNVTAYPISSDQFATIVEDITEKVKTQQKVSFLISHDQLTKLENRQALHDYLNNLKNTNSFKPVLILFDINGLSIINEAYGYDIGDQMLVKVAQIINRMKNKDSHAYRIDGDSFVLVCNGLDIDVDKSIKHIIDQIQKIEFENIVLSVTYGYVRKEDNDQSAFDLIKLVEQKIEQNKLFEEKSHRSNSIKAILATLTSKYDDERIHSERVSKFCELVAKKLEFDETDTAKLKLSGMIHDIGKIAIPDAILHKPGKLTDEEYEIIKTHTEIGYKILSSAKEYQDIALIALHHHERWDGTGYPKGLKGEKIPLFARIISVLDAYEAMTSNRVYRKAMSQEYAISELIRCSGSQFDPQIVDVFLEILSNIKNNKSVD